MIDNLVEISAGILILIIFFRFLAFVRRYSSPQDVLFLLGEALSLKSGAGASVGED